LCKFPKSSQIPNFNLKFERNFFLSLGPSPIFGPAAWALAFGRPATPHSSWALASQSAQPSPHPPATQPRRWWLACALPPPSPPPPSSPKMAEAPPLITPRLIPSQNGHLHQHHGAPPPSTVPIHCPVASLPLGTYKRHPSYASSRRTPHRPPFLLPHTGHHPPPPLAFVTATLPPSPDHFIAAPSPVRAPPRPPLPPPPPRGNCR
jgi:hypothetical protein